MKISIEMSPDRSGRMLTYHCPKGCEWQYVAVLPDGPAEITINSGMDRDEIEAAIGSALAKRDSDLHCQTEAHILNHILRTHLAKWEVWGVQEPTPFRACDAIDVNEAYPCVRIDGHDGMHIDKDGDRWNR